MAGTGLTPAQRAKVRRELAKNKRKRKVDPKGVEKIAPGLSAATAKPSTKEVKTAGKQIKREERKAEREAEFKQRRGTNMRIVAQRVNRGEISPREGTAQLKAAGFLPGGSAYKKPKGVPGFAAKVIGNLTEAGIYAVPGAIHAGKEVGKDLAEAGHATKSIVREKAGKEQRGPKGDFGFERTGKLAKEVGKSTWEDIAHPGRRPGYSLLTAFSLASLGAGTVARGSAVARTGSLRKPAPGTIVHDKGGLEVHTPASRNALVRPVQRALAESDRPVFRRGRERRTGKALREEQRVVSAIEGAKAGALDKSGAKLSTPQQTALRVVAEGKSIDERVAAHAGAYKAGNKAERKRIRRKIGLLEAARKYVTDVDGKPALAREFNVPHRREGSKLEFIHLRKGATAKDMDRAYERMTRTSRETTDTLVEAGVLSAERAAERVQAPGRVIEGAEMQTKGRVQRAHQALTRRDKALAAEAAKTKRKIKRAAKGPDTEDFRLAKQHSDTAEAAAQVSRRERTKARDAVDMADRRLERAEESLVFAQVRAAEGGSKLPVLERARAVQEAKMALDSAKKELKGAIRGGSDVARVQRSAHERLIAAEKDARAVQQKGLRAHDARLGRIAKERKRIEEQRALVDRDAGRISGAEDFKGGELYVSGARKRPGRVRTTVSRFRGGLPRKPSEVTHAYTEKSFKGAHFQDETTRVVADSHAAARSYSNLIRLRARLQKSAKDEHFEGAVPIKLDALKSKSLPLEAQRLVEMSAEGVKLTKAESARVGDILTDLWKETFPDREVPGVKWIDKRIVEKLDRPVPLEHSIGRGVVSVVDEINNATRLAILYLKPAYAAPNVAGNALLTLVHQGVFAPSNLKHAATANSRLGDDGLAVLDAVMGEGFIRSISGDGRGLLGPAVTKIAGVWSKAVDVPFRRAAWFHEARRAGFKTPEKQTKLLTDESLRSKLIEVSQRANEEIIDYGRLSAKERELVRRVVFVYPWVKGSTRYGWQFAKEHPAQALVGSQLAEKGKEQEIIDFGRTPLFARGMVKVGKRGAYPLAIATGGVTPVGGMVSVGEMVKGLLGGNSLAASADVLQQAGPLVQSGVAAATRRDLFTGRRLEGSAFKSFVSELVKGTPPELLIKRLRAEQKPEGEEERIFPYTGREAVEQVIGGPLARKPVNRAKLTEAALKEDPKAPADITARRAVFEKRKIYYVQAKKAGVLAEDGKLGEKTRAAFNVEAERQAAYAKARDGIQSGTREYHWARYQADIAFLIKLKQITPERGKEVLANAKDLDMIALKKATTAISDKYYQSDKKGGQLYWLKVARGVINKAGGSVE